MEKGLGKCESPELALGQTLEDSCTSGKHLFEFAMFLVLAQMFYVWKKWTGHAVRQWGIFSKWFPGVKALLLLRGIMCT